MIGSLLDLLDAVTWWLMRAHRATRPPAETAARPLTVTIP